MPFFKANGKLFYYAHVPKCGGSAVSDYMRSRFGTIAFSDSQYLSLPEAKRWTRSSPQHIDTKALEKLIPSSFFDFIFTIVRHPVARAVSTYHFQKEVEGQIAAGTGFSEWLASLPKTLAEQPFAADNHIRPMSQIVPEGATVFHLEYGLDPMVAWFDALTGTTDAPRVVEERNTRGAYVKTTGQKVEPSAGDLDLITRIYAEDFARFGYDPAVPKPKTATPPLSPEFMATRYKAQPRPSLLHGKLHKWISQRIRRFMR